MADAGADPPPLGAEADPTPPVHPPTPPIMERVQNLFTGRNRNRSNRRDNPDRIDRVESESQAGNEEEEDESDNDWSTHCPKLLKLSRDILRSVDATKCNGAELLGLYSRNKMLYGFVFEFHNILRNRLWFCPVH